MRDLNILGIDTSSKILSIGICKGGKSYVYNLEVARRLSGLLTPTIKRALDAADLSIQEIDYFACGLGPGSFTGIRVGLSCIKGLSWALNKPVIGISSLDILAKSVNIESSNIVPVVDAKRNLIYCSVYSNKSGCLSRVKPYMLLCEKEFCSHIKTDALLLGDAVELYRQNFLRNISRVRILDKEHWYPQGQNILALALERIKEKKFQSSFGIKPIYLYPKECQIRSQK